MKTINPIRGLFVAVLLTLFGGHLLVDDFPGGKTLAASVTAGPPSIIVTPGQPFKLTARVLGNPNYTIFSWWKDYRMLVQGSTYSVAEATIDDAGTYWAFYTDGVTAQQSPLITVTVVQADWIAAQPTDTNAMIGGTVALAVKTRNVVSPTFQWFHNGLPWVGGTRATLTITDLGLADAGPYYVDISDGEELVRSRTVTVGVLSAPVITRQPIPMSVAVGKPLTLIVTVSGNPPLSYQWRKNGVPISMATNFLYYCANTQPAQAGTYNVIVKNPGGTAISDSVTVTVITPAAIVTQPAAKITASRGKSATLSVKATGQAPLACQWYANGTVLAGQTNASCILTNLQMSDGGDYWVVVTNLLASVTSTVTRLTVSWPPTLTTVPANATVKVGDNVTFQAGAEGKEPLTYIWKKGATVVGGNWKVLALNAVKAGDAGQYSVTVTNGEGSVSSKAAVLTLGYPPTITQQPTNITPTFGANATLSLVVTGSTPIAIQWYTNNFAIAAGKQVKLTLAKVALGASGDYYAVVSNKWGMATSTVASVKVLFGAVIKQAPVGVTMGTNQTTTLKVVADGRPPLSYQWQFNGQDITAATNPTLTIGPASLADAGNYTVTVSNIDGAVTSKPALVKVAVGPVITQISEPLTVTNGATCTLVVTATGAGTPSYHWFLNGGVKPVGSTAQLKLANIQAGQAGTYRAEVTNAFGQASADVMVTVKQPPVITLQPANDTVTAGQTINLKVQAKGLAPLTYQWQKDAVDLVGATSLTLQIANASSANAGTYTVTIANDDGVAQSRGAVVSVKSTAKIAAAGRPSAEILSGQIHQGEFVLSIEGDPQERLTIEARTSLGDWEPVGQITVGDHGYAEFRDPLTPGQGMRLYRIGTGNP